MQETKIEPKKDKIEHKWIIISIVSSIIVFMVILDIVLKAMNVYSWNAFWLILILAIIIPSIILLIIFVVKYNEIKAKLESKGNIYITQDQARELIRDKFKVTPGLAVQLVSGFDEFCERIINAGKENKKTKIFMTYLKERYEDNYYTIMLRMENTNKLKISEFSEKCDMSFKVNMKRDTADMEIEEMVDKLAVAPEIKETITKEVIDELSGRLSKITTQRPMQEQENKKEDEEEKRQL